MLSASNDIKEYAVWVIAILIVAFGFRHIKDVIVFVLDKLYELLIQNNPMS